MTKHEEKKKKKSAKMRFNPLVKRPLVKFNNGVPHPDAEFKVQQYVNDENNRKKLLHVETPHMAYFGYSGNKQLDCKYLVSLLKKNKIFKKSLWFKHKNGYQKKTLRSWSRAPT